MSTSLGYLPMFTGIYCATVLAVSYFKDNFIYQPKKEIVTYETLEKKCKRNGTELHRFERHKGCSKKIDHYLYGILKREKSDKYILYCHGNAGNMFGRVPFLNFLFPNNYNVFMFDYAGYGICQGTPSEKKAYSDAYSAWKYLTNVLQVPAENIIIYGESLGGGIASWLTNHLIINKKVTPKCLILQSTFMSIKDMAPAIVSTLLFPLKNEFTTKKYIDEIKDKIPILLMHSEDDDVIPYNHCLGLWDVIKDSKNHQFYKIGGTHNSVLRDEDFFKCVEKFIEK